MSLFRSVDFTALNAFPDCDALWWRGPDRGLSAALAARPNIATVKWAEVSGQIDLSSAGLRALHLVRPGPAVVRLPVGLVGLSMTWPGPGVRFVPGALPAG